MLALELNSPFVYSSKSIFFWEQELLWWQHLFLPNKNSGRFHHNKELFNSPNEHFLVQISARLRNVHSETPIFYDTILTYCLLFWTQIFHSLRLFRIHHSPICESAQRNIFIAETSFSTANFPDTINSKQAINSNRGTDSSFTGLSLQLLAHNWPE